jgi:hypothetical protein
MAGGCEHLQYEKGPFPIAKELYEKLSAPNSTHLSDNKENGHIMTLKFPNGQGERKVLVILPEYWGQTIDFVKSYLSDDGYILHVPIFDLTGKKQLVERTVNPYEITEDQALILACKPEITEV